MKWKLITIAFMNLFINGSIYLLSILKDINVQGRFYLLIAIIIFILFLLNNNKGELFAKQILYVVIFIGGGFISIYLAIKAYNWIDILFHIRENITNIFAIVEDEMFRVIWLIIFEVSILIVIGHVFFVLIIKSFKWGISIYRHYEINRIYTDYRKNYKSILSLITIFLVVFGFLPTLIFLVDYKEIIGQDNFEKLTFSYNQYILIVFLVSVNPYIYLTLKEDYDKY